MSLNESECGLGRGEGNAVLIGRIAKADPAVSGILIQADGDPYIIIRAFNPVTGILLDVDKIVMHSEDSKARPLTQQPD